MKTRPLHVLRGEALRQQVLDTTLILFSDQGYFNTSIHDIRKAAGVSIGAIYHHFQNKEQLAKALYDDLLAHIDDAVADAVAGHETCHDRCRAIIARMFDMGEREPRAMEFVLLAKHREYLHDEPPICSSGPFARMREVLEIGIADGEVRELDPWVAASAMFGGALRMLNLHLDGVLKQPLSDYLDSVAECGWRAVAN